MKAYVFLFFLAICVFAATYVFVILPETKHKTFQEINIMFAKRNKIKEADLEMDEEGDRMVVDKVFERRTDDIVRTKRLLIIPW